MGESGKVASGILSNSSKSEEFQFEGKDECRSSGNSISDLIVALRGRGLIATLEQGTHLPGLTRPQGTFCGRSPDMDEPVKPFDV